MINRRHKLCHLFISAVLLWKWQKRDIKHFWHLFSLPFTPWDCRPKPCFRKWLWLQSQAFLLVYLGLSVERVGLFGPQTALKRRNAKHVKPCLSKKDQILRRQLSAQARRNGIREADEKRRRNWKIRPKRKQTERQQQPQQRQQTGEDETRTCKQMRFFWRENGINSAPVEGQQQKQLKTTSDVTSKFLWCCRASVFWSGKEALDVASDDPPDEALSCRRHAWDVPYTLPFPALYGKKGKKKNKNTASKRMSGFSGFKKALLQNPREMIWGWISREMIRVSARKSELQAKSQSYRPKVGVTVGQTPRIRTESPRKGPESGLGAFAKNPPLKTSWIQLLYIFFF